MPGAPLTTPSTLGDAYPPAPPEVLSSAAQWASSAALGSGSGSEFDPDDAFYLPPGDLPATPGTLIRTQPVAHPLNMGGPQLPGHGTKILYTSTTSNDEMVPVSGYVIEPARPWEGAGPTPTVVFAPGTRGAGDACAPSRGAGFTGAAAPSDLNINVNYELPFHYAATMRGMRVVVTDYIGLGTPGPHTYVNNTEQAHAVLDAARAGLAAAGAPADDPVGFWGYSQGGGATAAAAEHAPRYAPELNIKGTYSGAPPADLSAVMAAVDGSSIAGVLAYAIAGYADRDPEFAASIDRNFNAEGQRFVADNSDNCIVDSIAKWAMTDTRTLTNTGEAVSEITERDPAIAEAFRAEKLGRQPVTGPIMIGSSTADDIIPNSQVRQLGQDHCAAGAQVYYLSHDTPSMTDQQPYAVDHAIGMVSDTPESLNYLIDRFNDAAVPVNCGTF